MTTYLYCRTSMIEEHKGDQNLEEKLEIEQVRLADCYINQEASVSQLFIDRGEPWVNDFSDRPQASKMLKALNSGDTIIVSSLLRIFSSTEDLFTAFKLFKEQGVHLYVADLGERVTDEDCKLSFAAILKQFHRLEKRRSRERIKTVKQNQREKGRFLGGSRPFGYMIHSNGRLIENPMEQRVLKKIISLKGEGKSLRNISQSVSTPMVPVSYKTVQRILKRSEQGSLAQ